MTYSFDSSVLIDAQKWYPEDTHPSFWERIEALAKEKRLFISDMVLKELAAKSDEVFAWCQARQSAICCPSDAEVQAHLSEIVNAFRNFGQGQAGKNGADPWVVAAAMARGAVVVSHEGRSGSLNGPKIPDVCDALHIPVLRVQRFFREEGWTF